MRQVLWCVLVGAVALWGCSDGGGDGGTAPPDEMNGAGGGGGPEVVEGVEGLEAITIAPQSAQLRVGSIKQFSAIGTFAGGETRDLTELATWTTSDPAVVSISNETGSRGLATAHQDAPVVISASVNDIRSELTFDKTCDYPEFPGGIALGQVVPPVEWEYAYIGEGGTVEKRPFSLKDVYCKPDEWGHIRTFVIVFGAGWCGACSAFAQRLNADAENLALNGSMAMYIEFEDENYEPADTDWANNHLSRLIGQGPGIRVGDADTLPSGGVFNASGIIRGGIPVIAVLRTSDMRLIYDSNAVTGPVRLFDVLADPSQDWTMGDPDSFNSNCLPDQEEPAEPNNTIEQAALLEPGSFRGGICDEHADFYRIDHPGLWEFTLNFSHHTGDLDVYVWDVEEDKPLLDENALPVGSATLDDNESFQWGGPAVIKVVGHDFSSAGYLLTLRHL